MVKSESTMQELYNDAWNEDFLRYATQKTLFSLIELHNLIKYIKLICYPLFNDWL